MKRPLWIGTLGLAALALWLLGAPGAVRAAAAAGGPLDGRVFSGSSGVVGKTTGDQDAFVFKDGTFRSTACDAYGFGSAPYTGSRNPDGTISFLTETTSPKEGTIRWRGKVKGNQLTGAYTWEKAGQAPIHYWFKGTSK